MYDYVNFPQCVQTIYNYHYLKVQDFECANNLFESADDLQDDSLFEKYGINTGSYNDARFS